MLPANRLHYLWLIAALLILFPFLYLGWNGIAASDDYYDFMLLQDKGLWESLRHYYLHWSGRFVSYFFAFILNPLHLGEHLGPAVLNTLALSLLMGMSYFQAKIYIHLFKREEQLIPVLSVFACFWLMFIPRPVEIIFWFTGAMAYLLGPFFLSAWAWLHTQNRRTFIRKLLYAILPFLVAGGSEINVLLMGYVLVVALPEKRLEWRNFIWPLGFFILAALIELLAPGSRGRMNYFEFSAGNPVGDVAFSLQSSISMTGHYFRDWTRSTPLLFVAMLMAFFPAKPGSIVLSKFKWMLVCSWPLLIPTIYFPFFWGTGMSQAPDRLHDIVFLVLSTGFIFSIALIMQKLKVQVTIPSSLHLLLFIIILWQGSFTSRFRTALFDLQTLPAFNTELANRRSLIEEFKANGNNQDTLFLPQIKHIPYTIFYGDLSDNPKHWYNEGFAHYHKLKTVVCFDDSLSIP